MWRKQVKILLDKIKKILASEHLLGLQQKTSRQFATEAKFQTKPFLLHLLDHGPASEVTLTKQDALTCFERMTTIRKMEAGINNLYKAKIVRGFCHLYSGQEAVGVGVYASLRKNDTVITSYRNHAWAFLCNHQSVLPVIGEVAGTKSGTSRGKGGSMHLYGPNFYGGNAIVGAQVPLGVGIALAHKYKKTDFVSLTIYGDGAANNGQVFEAFNMAKMWDLPCLFLCENNLYSMGTSVPRSTANPDFYKKGDVIPGLFVDGMDLVSVKEAARFAVEFCASGKGPIILEAKTYRYFGHSLSDPGTSYRTHDEIQEVRKSRDPINNFKNQIIAANLVTADELTELDKKVKKIVDGAIKTAKADKEVGLEELTYDIYANQVIPEVRSVNPFQNMKHKTTGLVINKK
jgi:pyruvate dehydrogenase E1 component alpha subunit